MYCNAVPVGVGVKELLLLCKLNSLMRHIDLMQVHRLTISFYIRDFMRFALIMSNIPNEKRP